MFARREKSELIEASDLELDTRDLRGEGGSVVTRLGVVSVLNRRHAIEGEMGVIGGVTSSIVSENKQ